MANKDAKQSERKKRKKERKASDSLLAVPTRIDVSDLIHDEANIDDGTDMHTMNAREKYEHEKWNKRFMELEKYKEKNGHCDCPTNKGFLGGWIHHQRKLFRFKELKADRYEKLVGVGFVFENAKVARDNEKWNRRFMELVKYKEKNGHCNCPTKKNGSLGKWVSYQRTLFKSKKLNADRCDKLVGLGSYLRMRMSLWMMKYGIDASWSLWRMKKRMDIVISQAGMDRLGNGSRIRGLCSDPRNSMRIVMKNLWELGLHSIGRICIRNCWSIRRRKDIVFMC